MKRANSMVTSTFIDWLFQSSIFFFSSSVLLAQGCKLCRLCASCDTQKYYNMMAKSTPLRTGGRCSGRPSTKSTIFPRVNKKHNEPKVSTSLLASNGKIVPDPLTLPQYIASFARLLFLYSKTLFLVQENKGHRRHMKTEILSYT